MLKIRLLFPLRRPDLYDWQTEDEDVNDRIREQLLAAHKRVSESTPEDDHRPQVEAELLKLRGQSMSHRQLMLLYYLLAQCARARDLSLSANFGQALEWCGRAEQIAGTLLDFGAQVDLHELRGNLHRAISLYWIAAEEFSTALRVLREHADDTESFDPEFEVTLAAKAGAMDYLVGNFNRALEHVQRAHALLHLTTESVTGLGTVAWTYALLDRQRNKLPQAFQHAKTAAAQYQLAGVTISACRILSLAADIAMDIAESVIGELESACAEYVQEASYYAHEAIRVGEEAHDDAGIAITKLSLARLERIQGVADRETTEARIRAVQRQAKTMRDNSLLTAAQTALGAELLAFGDRAAGKRWLKRAIEIAARDNAPSLAFRAQRIIWKLGGRNG